MLLFVIMLLLPWGLAAGQPDAQCQQPQHNLADDQLKADQEVQLHCCKPQLTLHLSYRMQAASGTVRPS